MQPSSRWLRVHLEMGLAHWESQRMEFESGLHLTYLDDRFILLSGAAKLSGRCSVILL